MSAARTYLVACALLLAGSRARSVTAATGAAAGSTLSHFAGFDTIKTAQFHYNFNDGDFSFPVRFLATREGTDIAADRGNGNSERKLLHATGNVIIHQTGGTSASGKASTFTEKPSTLTCDTLDVDGNRKLYVATGNMHFTQEGGKEATSDRAVLDDANHHLHMEGHVRVRQGDRVIEAAALDYDTLSGQLDGNGNVTITTPADTPAPGPAPAATKKPKKHII
jgi:lipopolysaccharide assembly outer membrane protein LptD (OstA)